MPAPAGSRRNVIALVVAAILLAACFVGSPGNRNPADSTMTVEEFQSDIKSAVALAEQYWAAQFQAAGRSFAPIDQIMAGAYIGDSVRASALSLAPGDLDEFKQGLLAVGDDPNQPWFEPGAHGTAQQRADAFFGGYERSLAACGLA